MSNEFRSPCQLDRLRTAAAISDHANQPLFRALQHDKEPAATSPPGRGVSGVGCPSGSGPRRAAVGRVLLVLGRAEFRDLLCTAMHDSNTKSAALTEEPNREQIVDLGAECRTGLS